jgi:hypothetical protein
MTVCRGELVETFESQILKNDKIMIRIGELLIRQNNSIKHQKIIKLDRND